MNLQTTAYSVFDFTASDHRTLEAWAVPERLELTAAPSLLVLVEALPLRFGRQPPLPGWVLGGAILGLKDGANSFARSDAVGAAAGARVAGPWCGDWCGVRQTSFGRRLFWDRRWSRERYPDLPARTAGLRARGIRFLGYVTPYLCSDGSLFPEAEAAGFLARDATGAPDWSISASSNAA